MEDRVMDDVIRTERLTKHYGRRRVVDQLDLRVSRGCVYGLLGQNGAGKSTTLKMLAGLVHPDAGRAVLLDEDVARLSPATRGRIAYLAEGHPLYGWMSVREAVGFVLAFHPNADRRLVEQSLDHFALSPTAKIRRLSRGQRAQVSLVLALAPDPEVLLLDDPTLGLDTNVRRDFLESMIQLIQERGRTILFSSHFLGDVERVADRVGVMVDGVLRVDCPTEHFKRSVRKVTVELSLPLPPLAGLVSARSRGPRHELVVVGYGPAQRAALDRAGARRLDETDLNLEDAFIEYTRGQRGALPRMGTKPNLDHGGPSHAGAGTQGAA